MGKDKVTMLTYIYGREATANEKVVPLADVENRDNQWKMGMKILKEALETIHNRDYFAYVIITNALDKMPKD
jgi:hypothetical protein